MQSVDIETNWEEELEKLSQDYSRPFSPPLDIRELMPLDYPLLDTGVDVHEWYDAGASAASAGDFDPVNTILAYRQPAIRMNRKRFLKLKRGLL